MNQKFFKSVLGLILAVIAQSVIAAPSVVVDKLDGTDGPALAATATSASVTVVFTPVPGNTGGANFDIEFNKTALSTTLADSCAPGWVCSQVAAGIRFVSPPDFTGNLAGWTREVVFDLTAATAGTTYPLTVTNQTYADINFANLPPSGTVDGSIQILPPVAVADFNPNAGALNLGSAPQSTTNPSTVVTIDNTGPVGSLLNASCSITTNPGVFSVTNGTVTDLTTAATPHEVTVSCNSAAAVQTHNGQMTCTHNGGAGSDASPVVYPLSCQITAGPTPRYTSTPTPGSTLAFGNPVKDTTDPTLNVSISNSTGDDDTTLSSAGCTISSNPNNAYAITVGSGAFNLAKADSAHVVTVSCDTAVVGNHNGGVLSCPHNGSNTVTPATYPLTCQVDPVPTYGASLTAISPASIPQNNTPNPTGKLTITNSGDAGSNLSGTCSLLSNTGALAFGVGGGGYTVSKPGGTNTTADVNLVCNSSSQPGSHTATLSCTHNDPNQETPQTYPVSCTVDQPDPAIYGSTPAPGATIDITNGTPVAEGTTHPTAPLEIRNEALAGDASMEVTCGLTDVTGAAITASPADITDVLVAPGSALDVTFTCDTFAASDTPYEAEYSCVWFSALVPELPDVVDELQGNSPETYTVTCEVREGVSEVEPDPADGTQLSGSVPPGGSKSLFVTFNEVAGEGVPGQLNSCELASGADFSIISPLLADFPIEVPAGGSVQVEVQGTDPGGVETISDTLTCTYSDSDSKGGTVSYPLLLTIGGNAIFHVLKDFTDDNPGNVIVDLDCNTGLILDQQKSISENGIGVSFVVTDFDAGELNCNVTERPVAGYITSYYAEGDSSSALLEDGEPGCYFYEVAGGDENTCHVTNEPDYVDVVITKEWVYPSASASEISTEFSVVLYCDGAEILGGSEVGGYLLSAEAPAGYSDYCAYGYNSPAAEGAQGSVGYGQWCKTLQGSGNTTFIEEVKPFYWPGGSCYAIEVGVDQSVEVENGCSSSMPVSVGSGASCTITNTVFFEGIPTLSQYGMALMALLMLGVGFVAMRRIV